ncbi:hypothetical protein F2P56_032353 [Juglans regia]|uniref:Uncharacterized mitochondrial protein AtMg00810-like n=2 Tax=Juglans regia TaxID=51240 RepID=A0A2I4GLT7_JUGRE|nr:uncharacterized mitochondrial protein AtMg00810-like [Juglans regia]KAF5446750.1 hypothetical protein F2P56_032353 [Juglans regia]
MASTCTLTASDGKPYADATIYKNMVGSMQYLAFTRPDLAFAVHKVSRLISKATNLDLQAFSDSDWAIDRDDRRSVGAHCIFQGPNLISWSYKQQPIVTRSSTEAEYKTLANMAAELMWIKSILHELGISLQQPPTL